MSHVEQVVKAVQSGFKSATKFVSPTSVVRATLHGKPRRGENTEIVVTIGRPNFAERKKVAGMKKSGVAFPVRKLALKAHKR